MSKIRSAVLGLLLGTTMAIPAAAQGTPSKVYPYPDDPSWYPMDRFWNVIDPLDGRAQITGDRPYGGNGSLALSTTGDLWDWGFYARISGRDPVTGQLLNPWGGLSDVSSLGLQWRRETVTQTNPYGYKPWPDAPWIAQTPALRLLLGDDNGLLIGELVWEKYYTAESGYATPYNDWQEENLIGQNFWHVTNSTFSQYRVNTDCGLQDVSENAPWRGGLLLGSTSGWAAGSFGVGTAACGAIGFDLSDAQVYGIAVGVGSWWPDAYQGYVDYVRLDFDDPTNGTNAVYANFELPMTPVPEPGTVALLATGLLGLGGAQLLKRRNRKS